MRIISIHNGNVDPDIVKYQKLVFDYLGLDLIQVETKLQHPDALNAITLDPFEQLAIFDIDCIPLTKKAFTTGQRKTGKFSNTLYGCAQQANHIPGSKIYVSPFFMMFHKDTFAAMEHPYFNASEKGDVGYEVTLDAEQNGVNIEMLWPTEVEEPKWNLGLASTFGPGTTYQTGIYHAFQSRMGNSEMFVNKCKEVLDGKYK